MSKQEIKVKIDEDLYSQSKEKLKMSFSEFVEYCISLYINADDQYSQIFKNACDSYNKYLRYREKLHKLEKNNFTNENNLTEFKQAIDTMNRIHDKIGYIGKNQIRNIATRNDLNPNTLIHYAEEHEYDVRNFGDSPKQKRK